MTPHQQMVMQELRDNTPMAQLQQLFSSKCAALEQDAQQRAPMSPIEVREFERRAVQQLLKKAVELGLVYASNN